MDTYGTLTGPKFGVRVAKDLIAARDGPVQFAELLERMCKHGIDPDIDEDVVLTFDD